MKVVERTSTSVYFPDTRSFVYVPPAPGLRDAVLRWLEEDFVARALRSLPEGGGRIGIMEQIRPYFPDLSQEDLAAHLEYLQSPQGEPQDSRRELDALTGGRRTQVTGDGPPLLDAEVLPAKGFESRWVGDKAPFSRVVAVHRLAETRALAGFTRDEPPTRTLTGAPGFTKLWGEEAGTSPDRDWLPGCRVFGEGLLLELNSARVHRWGEDAQGNASTIELLGEGLTPEFQLAHTFAHLLMNAAALRCGYPIASLRDRIYAFPGRTALLIYTGEGDAMGTLGGLVELAQPGNLEPLLDEVAASAKWCGLDPVCMHPVGHLKGAQAGACHQCCLLPETSCSWWNQGLDRALLVGRGTLGGYLDCEAQV